MRDVVCDSLDTSNTRNLESPRNMAVWSASIDPSSASPRNMAVWSASIDPSSAQVRVLALTLVGMLNVNKSIRTIAAYIFCTMPVPADMRCSKGRSFLISRRIGSRRVLPSKTCARFWGRAKVLVLGRYLMLCNRAYYNAPARSRAKPLNRTH
jgi:hypothetical protein